MTERQTTFGPTPLGWRAVRWIFLRDVRRMSRRHLTYRTLQLTQGDTVRWLSDDIGRFLKTLERETAEMRANADCHKFQMSAVA
jgi:hypothetical protein